MAPKVSKAPTVAALTYCPRCFRRGDTVESCVDRQTMACPTPRPITEADATIECSPCSILTVIPVGFIMANKVPKQAVYCRGECAPENCKARLKAS